ncbi:DNA polymerase IV [bacterium]|nr:DNA polymerase IV [bacterium]
MERLIFHVDMDAFFASVEQSDNPSLKGKPVVVGADPGHGMVRGVVSAASYEARKYGIHSAMPISKAYRLCPDAVFLPVRMKRYKEVSREIMSILRDFSPIIEPVSIDEAFLDMTGTKRLLGDPIKAAEEIKLRVKREQNITASVGIAPNKLVAKIASDIQKPDGLVFVSQNGIKDFLNPLPVSRLWGVGIKTREILDSLGIKKVEDIVRLSEQDICSCFGKTKGMFLYRTSRGIDSRPVEYSSQAKSVSNEITFQYDVDDTGFLKEKLLFLSEKVSFRMRKQGYCGRTVYLKIRFSDFTTFVRNRTVNNPVCIIDDIYSEACILFDEIDISEKRVRLLGVGITMLVSADSVQQKLPFEKSDKREKAAVVVDKIKEKFGEKIIGRGKSS